ncbi:hypothetical protein Y016_09355 [Streptococcus thermophilus TH985]|nr:hypothetical protein Y016_09355 [Streptococcus thermophilus TH985]
MNFRNISVIPKNDFLVSKLFKQKRGYIISVVGKTTVEIIELFECTQKVP